MKALRIAALVGLCALVLLLVGSMVVGVGDREATDSAQRADIPARRIRVEVLNAAGIPRLAQRGTDRLRDKGFDVVYYGNAHGYHPDTSLVLDRVGDPAAARAVAEALGLTRVRDSRDTSLYLEATVILGSDWRGVSEELLSGAGR